MPIRKNSPGTTRFDDVKSESVSTGEILGTHPGKVRAVAGGEVVASIDPANTTTPVQDAIDTGLLADNKPRVIVPDGVSEAASVNVKGASIHPANGRATVNFTASGSTTDHGFVMDAKGSELGNVIASGPGSATTTGYGVYINGEHRQLKFDHVGVTGWGNDGFYSDAKWFESDIRLLDVSHCSGIPLNIADMGPANNAGVLKLNPDGVGAANIDSGELEVDTINIGGAPSGTPVDIGGGATGVTVSRINYEPETINLVSQIVLFRGGGNSHIDTLHAHTGDFDHVYALTSSARNHHMGRVKETTAANTNIVNVASDLTGSVVFEGESADVDNTSGAALSNPVSCLGDLTLVS